MYVYRILRDINGLRNGIHVQVYKVGLSFTMRIKQEKWRVMLDNGWMICCRKDDLGHEFINYGLWWVIISN